MEDLRASAAYMVGYSTIAFLLTHFALPFTCLLVLNTAMIVVLQNAHAKLLTGL